MRLRMCETVHEQLWDEAVPQRGDGAEPVEPVEPGTLPHPSEVG